METPLDIQTMHAKIRLLQQTARELQALSDDVPAVARNTARILASLKMLEMNICDAVELDAG